MDRFRILERVGSGGMGTVYRAFDERLQRDVAVKELPCDDAGRALREAQAAARLNHPGIATLYELGSSGDRTLLVSELVPGSTLAELARAGQLTDRDVAEIGAALCAALEHAHARGVVHRDVKPGNVIASRDGAGGWRTKLLDFGIASISGAASLTATGQVLGTLAYMAPEQADGERAGEEADAYSLALTLYECWAGTNPVARSGPAETARAIGTELPSLREYRPDLPIPLTEAVDACLVDDPAHRATVADLAAALEDEIRSLDAIQSVPEPTGPEPTGAALDGRRVLRVALGLAAGAGLGLVGGPLGAAAAAILLGALLAPILLATTGLPGMGTSALAGGLLLLPIFGTDALIGGASLAVSLGTFAFVLRLRHVALGLLAALIWAAAAAGTMRLVLDGHAPAQPVVIAGVALVAVLYGHGARRSAPPSARRRDGVGIAPA